MVLYNAVKAKFLLYNKFERMECFKSLFWRLNSAPDNLLSVELCLTCVRQYFILVSCDDKW